MRVAWFSLVMLLLMSPAWAADNTTRVHAALAGGRMTLDDGRTVRLAGIRMPDEGDGQALASLVAGHAVTLDPMGRDRYGDTLARVMVTDNGPSRDVAMTLTEQGAAYVYPDGTQSDYGALARAEDAARASRRGIWANEAYADTPADKARARQGRFSFVLGRVADVARVRDRVYVNFGEDWREDFTVEIASRDLRSFKKAGLDIMALKGKTVRVRGLVQRHNGPMIAVTDAAQVESLP